MVSLFTSSYDDVYGCATQAIVREERSNCPHFCRWGGDYFFCDKKKITDNDTDIKAIHPPDSDMSKLSISNVVIVFHLLSFGSAE